MKAGNTSHDRKNGLYGTRSVPAAIVVRLEQTGGAGYGGPRHRPADLDQAISTSLCPSGSCRHLLRQVKMTCRIPCRGDWLAADYPHGRRTERRLRGAASGTFQAKPATKTSEKYNCGSGSPSTEHVGRPASRMRCENTRAQACVTMRHLVPSPLDISRSYDHDL